MPYLLNHELQTPSTSQEGHLLFTLDLFGNIKFANSTAQRLLGYGDDELCRMNLAQVAAPEFANYIRDQISMAVKGQVGAVYEIELVTRDRRRVLLEASTHLVLRNGAPFELQGIAFVRKASPPHPRCVDENFSFGSTADLKAL